MMDRNEEARTDGQKRGSRDDDRQKISSQSVRSRDDDRQKRNSQGVWHHRSGHHKSGHRRRGHHRHGKFYRLRRWLRYNKKLAVGSALICAVIILISVIFLVRVSRRQAERHVMSGNSYDMGSGYRNLTYNGKQYQYNSLITTVLYAGIDSTGTMKSGKTYSNKARADSISLVVLDKKHKKMSILALSRDTMTKIRRYTLNGSDMGTYVSHLGYAYSYGDGGTASCENLREAVATLLGGIPINEYVVTNQSSMPYINNLVGGVTLTVPNDDLAEKYPKLTQGATVTLDDTTITDYLHYRDTAKNFSNEGRVERQQTYVTAYVEQLRQKLEKDLNGTWEEVQEMDAFLQTSITRNKYIGLVNLLDAVTFTDADYYRPEGKNQEGELHDEFYADEDALKQMVLNLFYEEI